MLCHLLIEPAPPGIAEMLERWWWIFIVVGGGIVGVLVGIKRLREGNEPARRILPDPLTIKHDDPFIRKSEFDKCMAERSQQMSAMKDELTARIVKHEDYVHDCFHEMRKDFQTFSSASEVQREGVHGRLNVIFEVLYDLRGFVRGRSSQP